MFSRHPVATRKYLDFLYGGLPQTVDVPLVSCAASYRTHRHCMLFSNFWASYFLCDLKIDKDFLLIELQKLLVEAANYPAMVLFSLYIFIIQRVIFCSNRLHFLVMMPFYMIISSMRLTKSLLELLSQKHFFVLHMHILVEKNR